MNLHELALLIAYSRKHAINTDVALLVNADTGRPISWAAAGVKGPLFTETCAVRLLQAEAQHGFGEVNCYLYLTAPPTAMCLGMTLRCHVTHMFFLHGGQLSYLTPADIAQAPRALDQHLGGVLPGHWAQAAAFTEAEAIISRDSGSVVTALAANDRQRVRLWRELVFRTPGLKDVWFAAPFRQPVAPPQFMLSPYQSPPTGGGISIQRLRIYMTLAFALLHASSRWRARLQQAENGPLGGQNVACVLIGPDGKLLSWGVNTNAGNVTRHAEVNCIQSYLKQTNAPIPDGAELYTTLQSCAMCAGMLATVARRTTVVYATRDPAVTQTALKAQINGSKELRLRLPGINPLARGRLQNLMARYVKSKKTKLSNVVRADMLSVAESEGAVSGRDKAELAKAANVRTTRLIEHIERGFGGSIHRALTKALKSQIVMDNIANLHRDYHNMLPTLLINEATTLPDLIAWADGLLLLETIELVGILLP